MLERPQLRGRWIPELSLSLVLANETQDNNGSFTNLTIIGANSGVGFAASKVLALASDSFHVIMTARSHDKAEAAKSEIEAANPKGTVSTLQLDVTSETSVEAAAAHVLQRYGRLDVLVNNAGTSAQGSDIATSFRICLETNVAGPAMVASAFRPLLVKSRNPYSIYVGSGQRTLVRNVITEWPAVHKNIKSGGAYMVSKAALNMLAMIEWREYGHQGLKVFVMSPGFVRSNLRGSSEEAVSGWGQAGDPVVPGELLLSIVEGKRDADVGCFVHTGGVFPW